jgi:FixJ family two-component response regulator
VRTDTADDTLAPSVTTRGRFDEDGSVMTSMQFKNPMMEPRLLVSIVDDDESVRESLPDLLHEFGFDVQTFSSAEEFLTSADLLQTDCLIVDMKMPGMSGRELQVELRRRCTELPLIFITAHQDEAVRLGVLAEGAIECLFKPFSDTALLAALKTVLRESRKLDGRLTIRS